jgi:hypothetical protein
MGHFAHGYAVTSHNSQGLTANRVLINDTEATPAMTPLLSGSTPTSFPPKRGSPQAKLITQSPEMLTGWRDSRWRQDGGSRLRRRPGLHANRTSVNRTVHPGAQFVVTDLDKDGDVDLPCRQVNMLENLVVNNAANSGKHSARPSQLALSR